LIRGAAAGQEPDRAEFVRLYEPAVRACLKARWHRSPLSGEVDDAIQDVFIECFREGGALERVEPETGRGGFRAYLHAIVRNVARRFEERRRRQREERAETGFEVADDEADDAGCSLAFDRAWMLSLLDQAVALQTERAQEKGEAAKNRVELLRLRFNDELPIREIARRWNQPADFLHHEYAQARKEFMAALKDVIAFHFPDDPAALKRELERFREYVK